jgi:hypothetical protein
MRKEIIVWVVSFLFWCRYRFSRFNTSIGSDKGKKPEGVCVFDTEVVALAKALKVPIAWLFEGDK